MSEIRFYHLQRASLEDTLPVILERAYGRGDRILVMTGSGGPDEWKRLSAMGADRFLVKPVNLEDVERQLVVQALERANHNQTKAAELLGLNRDQVRYRMEKFGLKKADVES